MNPTRRILIVSSLFLLTSLPVAFAQEEITLTTYYPAPFGEYQRLRLFPPAGGGPLIGDACDAGVEVGVMQYSENAGTVVICNNAGIWVGVVIAREPVDPCPDPPCPPEVFWGQTGSYLYPLEDTWNVGIGTSSPAAKLEVDGSTSTEGIRATGNEWGIRARAIGAGVQGTGVRGDGHIGVRGVNPSGYVDPGATGVSGRCYTVNCVGVDARVDPAATGTPYALYAEGGAYAGYFNGRTFLGGDVVPAGDILTVTGTQIRITGGSRLLQLGTWGSGNDIQSWDVPLYINYSSTQPVNIGTGSGADLIVKGNVYIYGYDPDGVYKQIRFIPNNPGTEIGSSGDRFDIWYSGVGYNDVAMGNLTVSGNATVSGNLTVTGTKTFTQPHPTDPTKEINYIVFEGRESRIFFDGVSTLEKGEAKISVPEDFRLVASKDNLNVILTPFGETEGLYVSKRSLDDILVKEKNKGSSNISFGYLVIGTRKGFEVARPIQENTHFRPEKYMTQEKFKEYLNIDEGSNDYYAELGRRLNRNLLISNGTLLPDGKVNPKTAERLGWEFSKEVAMTEKEGN